MTTNRDKPTQSLNVSNLLESKAMNKDFFKAISDAMDHLDAVSAPKRAAPRSPADKTAQMIAVMQAHLAGKPIEWRRTNLLHSQEWQPTKYPVWEWASAEYRVKVETAASRRFLWRSPNGKLQVSMVTPEGLGKRTFEEYVKQLNAISCQTFVRWIDAGWVEVSA